MQTKGLASMEQLRDDISLLEQMRPESPLVGNFKKQLSEWVVAGGVLSESSWMRTALLTPDEPYPGGKGEKIMCLTPWLQRAHDREQLRERLRELVAMESED